MDAYGKYHNVKDKNNDNIDEKDTYNADEHNKDSPNEDHHAQISVFFWFFSSFAIGAIICINLGG